MPSFALLNQNTTHIFHNMYTQEQSQLKTSFSHTHTSQFYFLNVWQAGELTYGTREVVSLFTKSCVGHDTICSKGGGFQIVGSVPTGKVTSLTNKIG